jgi:putative methyltransferase
MALVLVHDLLFTKRGIQSSDGPLKQAVMRHKARLKAELVKYKIKVGAKSDDDLVSQKVKDAGTCLATIPTAKSMCACLTCTILYQF